MATICYRSIFVGWVWGRDAVMAALSNDGALRNGQVAALFYGLLKMVTPVLVLLVLAKGLI